MYTYMYTYNYLYMMLIGDNVCFRIGWAYQFRKQLLVEFHTSGFKPGVANGTDKFSKYVF